MSESGPGPGTSARMKEEDKKIKLIPKNAKSMSTSAKRMQKELGEITLDPPPNCRYPYVLRSLTADLSIKPFYISHI